MSDNPWGAGADERTVSALEDASLGGGRAIGPFEPDKEGPEYVYIRFADHIQAHIEAGLLRPGHRLPAEKDLAAEYGIAYHSVRRAMQELRERGLIQTVPGRGTYVARRDENAETDQ